MNRRQILMSLPTLPLALQACSPSQQSSSSVPEITKPQVLDNRRLVETNLYYANTPSKAAKKLNVLFLGGTDFLGPATVRWLTLRGHDVTLFNRGRTRPDLFPNLEKRRGDRLLDNGLESLGQSDKWDIVIDTWSGAPEAIRQSAEFLLGRVNHYIYVSTISVYGRQNFGVPGGFNESVPLPESVPLKPSPQTDLDYSARKLAGDKTIQTYWPAEALTILRPHSIPGPFMKNDSTNQQYWPMRLQFGGSVLAPGHGEDVTQWVDVRDVAQFLVRCAERRTMGIYNMGLKIAFKDYLSDLQKLSSQASEITWVEWSKMQELKLQPFWQMPMFVPNSVSSFFGVNDERAIRAGLTYRSVKETFPDVIRDFRIAYGETDYPFGKNDLAGLALDEEAELLGRLRG